MNEYQKIVFDQPCVLDTIDVSKLKASPLHAVSCYGFDSEEAELYAQAIRESYRFYQFLIGMGTKKKYAAGILPLCTVYRRGNRRVKRAVKINPVGIRLLTDSNAGFTEGLGI